jgi:hypothetical protein
MVAGILVDEDQKTNFSFLKIEDEEDYYVATSPSIVKVKVLSYNLVSPITKGDLLVSSGIEGYLMKDDDDVIISATICKALEDCIFVETDKYLEYYVATIYAKVLV